MEPSMQGPTTSTGSGKKNEFFATHNEARKNKIFQNDLFFTVFNKV